MYKKHLGILVAALIMIVAFAMVTFAEWRQMGNEWLYYDENGQMKVNSWIDEDYYVGSDGFMLRDKWMQRNISGKTCWSYFDTDGKLVKDRWYDINDQRYHFDSEGIMETGWILDNMYYCDPNKGYMMTGWQKLDDPEGQYEKRNPDPYENVNDLGKHWYYLQSTGKKYVPESTDNGFGEKKIDGKRFCFDDNGALQTGWVDFYGADTIGSYKFYNADGSGREGWYSLNPPEALASNYDSDVVWFYFEKGGTPAFDADGIPTTMEIKRIGNKNKRYLFDKNGTPVHGFKKVYTGVSMNDYETYYFGTPSQCCVQTGKLTNFQNENGSVATYYFTDAGRGYSGCKDGMLYYKGLLQKASEDCRYEVIKVNGLNYLVGTTGKVQKSKKVKDKDGVQWTTSSSGIVTKEDGETYRGSGRDPEEPEFD